MTDLARSRSDQFIDRLSGFIEVESKPEPGYRRRPKPDWLSEFADERLDAANEPAESVEVAMPGPPLSLDLEPDWKTHRRMPTVWLAVLAPMVALAAVSSAIGLLPSLMLPGELPVVRSPVMSEVRPPAMAAEPLLAEVPREPETTKAGPISNDPGLSARSRASALRSIPAREAQDLEPTSPRLPGSTPHEIETAAVQDTLDRYRASLATSSTVGIEFHSCGVELSAGGRATARCTGRATFVPKAGGRSARVESRAWSFALARVDDRWNIVSVESR